MLIAIIQEREKEKVREREREVFLNKSRSGWIWMYFKYIFLGRINSILILGYENKINVKDRMKYCCFIWLLLFSWF